MQKESKQLILLDNIKYYIDKIKNLSNITKELHNELMDYLGNNILKLLSKNKINFDLSILKNKFNITVNYKLLKDKSLFFLY